MGQRYQKANPMIGNMLLMDPGLSPVSRHVTGEIHIHLNHPNIPRWQTWTQFIAAANGLKQTCTDETYSMVPVWRHMSVSWFCYTVLFFWFCLVFLFGFWLFFGRFFPACVFFMFLWYLSVLFFNFSCDLLGSFFLFISTPLLETLNAIPMEHVTDKRTSSSHHRSKP